MKALNNTENKRVRNTRTLGASVDDRMQYVRDVGVRVKPAHFGRIFQRHVFDRLQILRQRIEVQHLVSGVETEIRVEHLVGKPKRHYTDQQPSIVIVGHAAAVVHLA